MELSEAYVIAHKMKRAAEDDLMDMKTSKEERKSLKKEIEFCELVLRCIRTAEKEKWTEKEWT